MLHKLYTIKHHLLVYETCRQASIGEDTLAIHHGWDIDAAQIAREMSLIVGGKVSYSKPDDVILLLEKVPYALMTNNDDDIIEYWHVLIGEKIGWIIIKDWLEIIPLEPNDHYRPSIPIG